MGQAKLKGSSLTGSSGGQSPSAKSNQKADNARPIKDVTPKPASAKPAAKPAAKPKGQVKKPSGGQSASTQKSVATAKKADVPAKAPGKNVQAAKGTAPAKKPAQQKKPAQVYKLQGGPSNAVPLARPRRRHGMLLASFLLLVILPTAAIVGYLYTYAADRYASNAAFFVHKEETASASEMFSGLSALGAAGTGTPDADILYQYIQSQSLVEAVDAEVDLRKTHSLHFKTDPVFSLDPNASLEDVVKYWDRVISVVFESDTGLITLEVTAFTSQDAQKIATVVLEKCSDLITRLSKIARDDTISLAQEELNIAAERLKATRLEMSEFRDVERIIDPTADIAGQMGVITALQQSLAQSMIQRDLLIGTTSLEDPRILQADRSIAAIENRIEEERRKVGAQSSTESGDVLSRVVGDYEGLVVDRQFAEQSYVASLAAYDAAVAEARRKSRYLAVHIEPTKAETAIYPRRLTLAILGGLFVFMVWALLALTAYSIRDRR